MISKKLYILFCFCFITSNRIFAKQIKPQDITISDRKNEFYCNWDNTQRKFSLYLPEENPKGIFIMLHGAGQTIQSFKSLTKMEQSAVPAGYAVCYVSSGKDGVWNSGNKTSKKDDLGFICALARFFQDTYNLQKESTFLCGFSNGAFMTHYTALQKKSPFGSIIAVAGLAPLKTWTKNRINANCNLFQVYGSKDDLVLSKEEEKPNVQRAYPYIEDVTYFWINHNKLELLEEGDFGNNAFLSKYGKNSKKFWLMTIKDYPHQWPASRTTGFELSDIIVEFVSSSKIP
ncbi:MAG: hypothetical protein MJ182_10705 [Treponema sp.]|nr:hypothetical protein [Treponema sp.]